MAAKNPKAFTVHTTPQYPNIGVLLGRMGSFAILIAGTLRNSIGTY